MYIGAGSKVVYPFEPDWMWFIWDVFLAYRAQGLLAKILSFICQSPYSFRWVDGVVISRLIDCVYFCQSSSLLAKICVRQKTERRYMLMYSELSSRFHLSLSDQYSLIRIFKRGLTGVCIFILLADERLRFYSRRNENLACATRMRWEVVRESETYFPVSISKVVT